MHRVNEIMSQDVVRIAPTDSIRHAAQLMERYDIGALPVCDNNRLVGMVTDRDLAVRAISVGKPPETRIQEVASARSSGVSRTIRWTRSSITWPMRSCDACRSSITTSGWSGCCRSRTSRRARPARRATTSRTRSKACRSRSGPDGASQAARDTACRPPVKAGPHHRNGPSRQGNDGRPPRQPSCFVTRTILSASSRTSTGLR